MDRPTLRFSLCYALVSVGLVGCAILFVAMPLREDGSPPARGVFGFVTFHDRHRAGYHQLPEYQQGYFDLYRSESFGGRFFSYSVADEAYWPDGDPGRGEQNPLPPFVKRYHTCAIADEMIVGFFVLA